MTGLDSAFRMWAKSMHGVTYVYQKTEPVTEDLEAINELVRKRALKAVVGKTTSFEDLEEIRAGCMAVLKGKGGVGKFVIKMKE